MADTYEDCYAWYKGHGIGKYETNSESILLNDNGNRFLMSLNVEGIMQKEEETSLPSYLDAFKTLVSIDDTYVDTTNTIYPYKVVVQEVGGRNVLTFVSSRVMFMAVCTEASAPELAASMLKIARSLNVDENKVNQLYGADSSVNYYGKKIRLFENMTPEDGMISEILEKNDSQ